MDVVSTPNHRAEVATNLPVGILMAIEISLLCFSDATSPESASIGSDVGLEVTAMKLLANVLEFLKHKGVTN